MAKSIGRQRIWRNNGILWLASSHDAPRSFRIQYALGDLFFDIGQPESGIEAYRRAIAASPEPWVIRNDLARRLREVGKDTAAIDELKISLSERPDQPDARAELIAALIAVGEYELAIREARTAASKWIDAPIFAGLSRVADSALIKQAPPGTVRLKIRTGADLIFGSGR